MTHIGHTIPIPECDVHDAPPAIVSHVLFVCSPTDMEGSGEIGLYYCLKALGGELLGRTDKLTTGVVYQEMKCFVVV